MSIITNLYIILNTYQYKEDFIKLIRKIKFLHIIIVNYNTFINTMSTITNNDLLLFFIETEDQLTEFIEILNMPLIYKAIFVHASNINFYASNTMNIHYLPTSNSIIEILHHIEPYIPHFQHSFTIPTTVDMYIEEVLENIGASRHLTGYKYLKFILNYALKHYYLDKNLYLLACNSCASHFEVNLRSLEKSLRDLISYAYTNNYNYAYLFFLHYNLIHHKPTNTKYIEAAMNYTIEHFRDIVTTK